MMPVQTFARGWGGSHVRELGSVVVHRAPGTPRARSGHGASVFFVHRGLRPLKIGSYRVCPRLRLPSQARGHAKCVAFAA